MPFTISHLPACQSHRQWQQGEECDDDDDEEEEEEGEDGGVYEDEVGDDGKKGDGDKDFFATKVSEVMYKN